MENFKNKYFLAANSATGFVSYFDSCCNPKENCRCFIIKGGPGTGKSSFMKKVAETALENGYDVEVSPCSSDPNSLDAVIIPQKGIVIMDGTAPHTVDPKYPAAVETILNFGDFWNEEALIEEKRKIISLTDQNKALHKSATMLLRSAGLVLESIKENILSVTDTKKACETANRLSRQYLRGKGNIKKEKIRFLTGISPLGVVTFEDTVNQNFDNIIAIKDEYGFVSSIIMEIIRKKALEKSYEIITLKNAFLPELTDHILIPEFSLAFVRQGGGMSFETGKRKIHIERFIKGKWKDNNKKKLLDNIILSAVLTLKKAKAVHDDLEEVYKSAMDYKRLDDFVQDFIKSRLID